MNAAAAIVADIRRAIELLADSADPAATRTAAALDRWIRGEAFEQSLDLPTDWRMRLRISARDAALRSLIALHPELHDEGLAERIVAGVRRINRTAVRPDGESGLLQDLAYLELPGVSRLRRILAALRGYQGAGLSHDQPAPSRLTRRANGRPRAKKAIPGPEANSGPAGKARY